MQQFDPSRPSNSLNGNLNSPSVTQEARVREVLASLPSTLTRRGAECPACNELLQLDDFGIPSLLAISLKEEDQATRRLAIKELGAMTTKVVSLMKVGAVDDMDRATEVIIEGVSALYQSALQSQDRVFKEDVFTALSRVGIDPEFEMNGFLGKGCLTHFTDPFTKVREKARSLLRELLEQ